MPLIGLMADDWQDMSERVGEGLAYLATLEADLGGSGPEAEPSKANPEEQLAKVNLGITVARVVVNGAGLAVGIPPLL